MNLFYAHKFSIGFIIALLLTVAGYFIHLLTENNEGMVSIETLSYCDFQNKKCHIETKDFEINIFTDKDIEYLKIFNIFVLLQVKKDFNVLSQSISFNMKNMDMGINKFILTRKDGVKKIQTWKGKAQLPICITGQTDWLAELSIQGKDTIHLIKFPLSVK